MPIEFTPLWGDTDGFDGEGLDAEGYNRDGYREDDDDVLRDREGYDYHGFDANGRDREGYDANGRDREGYDPGGYDEDGFDANGRDREGYDEDGYRPDFRGVDRNRDGYDREGYDEDGYDEDGCDREGYDVDGYRPYFRGVDRNRDGYDFRYGSGAFSWLTYDNPELIFHALDDEDPRPATAGTDSDIHYTPRSKHNPIPGVPYYGMEIELSSNDSEEERDIIESESLVWAKEDGSVEGFEMCTHPMTEAWAKEHFPWGIVRDLGRAGSHVYPESNGLHIHVSRSGFRNWAHQYSWVKFFYANEEKIAGPNRLAGRYGDQWGSFSYAGRDGHFGDFKLRMAAANGSQVDYYSWRNTPRYVAINCQNDATMEVRCFASTVDPDTLRMRFELVAASVEYTRNLTAREIYDGGWEWNHFVRWLTNNEGRYPALENTLAIGSIRRVSLLAG